jgi:hypothetical protein
MCSRSGKRTDELRLRDKFTPIMHLLRTNLPQRDVILLSIFQLDAMCLDRHSANTDSSTNNHVVRLSNRNLHSITHVCPLSTALQGSFHRTNCRYRTWCCSNRSPSSLPGVYLMYLTTRSSSRTFPLSTSCATTENPHCTDVLCSLPGTQRLRTY